MDKQPIRRALAEIATREVPAERSIQLIGGYNGKIAGMDHNLTEWNHSLIPWLADTRFWGLPFDPPAGNYHAALLIAGFAIILLFIVLAILQGTRLAAVRDALGDQGRFTSRAGLLLALPVPFVLVAGFVMINIISPSSIRPLRLVDTVIERGRTYEGNLFQLAIETDINYPAITDVREQMSDTYTLQVGEIRTYAVTSTMTIAAHFDNGFRANCPVNVETLAACYEARPLYAQGLANLLTGQPSPGDCPHCAIAAGETWLTWLQARRQQLGPRPQVRMLLQRGRTVAVRSRRRAVTMLSSVTSRA